MPEPATSQANPDEVTVQDMKKALDDPTLGIKVVDVREPDEYEIAKVKGVPLLPLSELPNRFTELDPNQQYYLHCKAGVRSLKAMNFLKQQGFKKFVAFSDRTPPHAGNIAGWVGCGKRSTARSTAAAARP